MLFADRVYRHCFRGGPLTEDNVLARWRTLTEFIEDAVLAESARWGAAREEVGATPRTRENTFYPEVERVADRMRGNVEQLLESLRQEGYYPTVDPPEVAWDGSTVVLRDPNPSPGDIYFTVDGTDPRAPGGVVSPGARVADSGNTVEVDAPLLFKSRIKTEKEWSALWEAN